MKHSILDRADVLRTEDAIAAYLKECEQQNDPELMERAQRIAAQARERWTTLPGVLEQEYPYTVEEDEDGNFLVQFVDFREAITDGLSLEHAAANAREVLALVIEQRIADGQAIPLPSAVDTGHRAAPELA